MYEIIYKCNSINNKNVRDGELNILRKFEDSLYFEFGENENNIKKRFYNDLETLNKDYEELLKLKTKEKAHELVQKAVKENKVTKYEDFSKTEEAKEWAEPISYPEPEAVRPKNKLRRK